MDWLDRHDTALTVAAVVFLLLACLYVGWHMAVAL